MLRFGLGVLQNAVDLVVAFFLVLGGWNATNSHAVIGYSCMLLGPVLLYLSSGMWTGGTWKLIGRTIFYGGALLALGLSATVLTSLHAFPTVDGDVIYLLIGSLFLAVLLSMVHFRLVRRESAALQ
jgi:hypothetical protein